MKKGLALLLTVMLLMIGTGFGTSVFAEGGKEVIQYWYPWGGDSEIFDKEQIAQFEAAYPQYKVEATYVPSDGGISNGKLMAAIAAGNPPDIIVTAECALAYALATQGAFEPLEEALTFAGINEAEIGDTFKDIMKFEGTSYLVPRDVNLSALFINTDLYQAAGLDIGKPPQTLAELDAAAEKLTVKNDDGTYSRLGFIPWIDGGDDALMWPYMFGADVFDVGASKVSITSKAVLDSLSWQRTYAEKYDPEKVNSFASGFGEAFSADHPFMTGKVAMTVQGNWFTNALKIYAPELHYIIVPIPAPENGRYGGSSLSTNVYGIPKGAKNPNGAAVFMKYMLDISVMDPLYAEWRSVSPFPAQYPELTGMKNQDPLFMQLYEIGANENSGHQNLTSVSKELADTLRQIRDDVIYNSIDPTPDLEDVQERLQEQVDKDAR